MKIKVIHQWRDWLLESVGVGHYSFIEKDNKTAVRTIVAKNDIDAENQCQGIINAAKKKISKPDETTAMTQHVRCRLEWQLGPLADDLD